KSEWAAGTKRVAKLPRRGVQMSLGDQISREIPAASGAREDQLRLDLALLFMARFVGRFCEIAPRVEADDFLADFVGSIDVGEFDIQDGIDRVFTHEEAESILEAVSGEAAGVAVQIQRGCPPPSGPVFELEVAGECAIAGLRDAKHGIKGDLEAAGFL